MSETQTVDPQPDKPIAEADGAERPGTEAPTGWHLYDGKAVIVQLFEPYIAGMDPESGSPVPIHVLEGVFRIFRGAAEGTLLFVLNTGSADKQGYISMQPSDVKHITYIHQDEPSEQRIVTP